jgi:lipopolysaccharide transport system permease protein
MTMSTPVPALLDEEIVVRARGGEPHYWRDLWRHRELLWFLVWRDIIVRYKQTVIGIAWSVLRPLMTTVAMVIVFGRLAGLRAEGVPYTLLVLTGLLCWQLFATALTGACSSVVGSANLISKIYLPRLIIPTSAVLAGLVDYLISCGVLALLMLWFHYLPTWRVLLLPGLTLLTLLTAIGAGLWFGALNVRYRDFNNIIPLVLQIGMYVSPVGYSSLIIPERWRLVYSLNPMAGLLDGYRWALLGKDAAIYWPGFCLSMVLVALLLVSGIWYFRRMERTFADVI